MKKTLRKRTKVTKGGPSGLVISLIVHAAAFFVAGVFVVFTIMPEAKPAFEPPLQLERPKMKLRKPRVKIKKSSQPKPSSRIVAKVKTAKMPEIQIPDLVGSGEGLLGGLGGGGDFMDMPELGETTSLLGSTESVGTELVGRYYDIKRSRSGNFLGVYDRDQYLNVVYEFLKSGWDTSKLSKYYQLPRKLYLTALVVPVIPSAFAPIAFGDSSASEGGYWLVHYKGELVHKEGITFRFWAAGDFLLVVRVNGEIVVAGVFDIRGRDVFLYQVVGDLWSPSAPEHRQYIYGRNALAAVGDWITLEPGVPQDIEILVGDEDGLACAYLAVEEQGVEYEIGDQGGRILPAFRTTELTHDMLDVIYRHLPENELICLTNGPVFNDLGYRN